jgi:hypothetical protein
MSYVQNVLIAGGDRAGMEQLNLLVRQHTRDDQKSQEFTDLTAYEWGGYKGPECDLWACAFNYGPSMDDLIDMVEAVTWRDPACIQIFYMDQNDLTFEVWPVEAPPRVTAANCPCPHCTGDHGPWYPEKPADYDEIVTPGHRLTEEQIKAAFEAEGGIRFTEPPS